MAGKYKETDDDMMMDDVMDETMDDVEPLDEPVTESETGDEVENGNILKLTRTYDFDDRKISQLDFSGFDDLEVADLNRAADQLTNAGRVVLNPEMDAQYCLYLAASATRMPHEFFRDLKIRDVIRIKNKMRNLFYGRG